MPGSRRRSQCKGRFEYGTEADSGREKIPRKKAAVTEKQRGCRGQIIMVIGSGLIELWIAESRSLKEKRGVLKRIIQRTRNAFNVSIAEVGDNDSWKRAKIGFCTVGNDVRYVNGKVDHILSFVDDLQLAEVLSSKVEVVTISDAMPHFEDAGGKYDHEEQE